MTGAGIVIIVFLAGVIIIVAEIFLPAHGLLGVAGVAALGYAVYRAYTLEDGAFYGHVTLATAMIVVPIIAITGVKLFPRTPLGRRIAPDNPVAPSGPDDHLARWVGHHGTSATALRPVGVCSFDGHRIQCVAESELIDADQPVVAVGIRGQELEVRPASAAHPQKGTV